MESGESRLSHRLGTVPPSSPKLIAIQERAGTRLAKKSFLVRFHTRNGAAECKLGKGVYWPMVEANRSQAQRHKGNLELPRPGMNSESRHTDLVLIDLQNDFLNSGGIAWGLVAECLAENHTIENLETLFRAAWQH
jgi:hypothetical protein